MARKPSISATLAQQLTLPLPPPQPPAMAQVHISGGITITVQPGAVAGFALVAGVVSLDPARRPL